MEAVEEFIKALQFERPKIYRNLGIAPLIGKGREKDFLLLKEALEQGLLIKEQPNQRVAELNVENNTGNRILLIRGLYMRGGGQNRQIASNAFLEDGFTGTIPTECVEQKRWDQEGRRDFGYGGMTTIATRITDTSIAPAARQQTVWRSVEDTICGTGTVAPSRDLGQVYEQQGPKLDEYLQHFSMVEGQLGLVAAIGINGKRKFIIDLFDSHEALQGLFEDLVKSYALESLIQKTDKVEATMADINLFLHAFKTDRYTEESRVSLGINYTVISDKGEGTTLIEGNRVRYATASKEM